MLMNDFKACDILRGLCVMLLVSIFFLTFLTISLCNDDFPNSNKTVYTTKTGECYHLNNCPTLKHSKYKTTLGEAVKEGYESCSWCDSPVLRKKDSFSYDGYDYLILVPCAALCSWAATGEILKYSDIHYIIHLLVNFSLASLISLIF